MTLIQQILRGSQEQTKIKDYQIGLIQIVTFRLKILWLLNLKRISKTLFGCSNRKECFGFCLLTYNSQSQLLLFLFLLLLSMILCLMNILRIKSYQFHYIVKYLSVLDKLLGALYMESSFRNSVLRNLFTTFCLRLQYHLLF